jgi:hypothetical protein
MAMTNMARTSWVFVAFGDVVDWVTRRPRRAAAVWGLQFVSP